MRLYIIRHADPDYPNNTITPTGHREAAALARRMAQEGLTRIYSSPLERAKITAGYTARATGLTPVIEDWTCEIGGCFYCPPGKPDDERVAAWDIPGELIRAGDAAPWLSLETWDRIDPETAANIRRKYDEVRCASDEFLKRHGYERVGGRYRVVRSNRERIAIFCHNGSALYWLAHLLELPLVLVWSGFWHAPSSVTTVLFDERSEQWAVPRALSVGDCSHLYAEGMTPQPRGIIANYD